MEFSEVMSMHHRTQKIESLADELDFYDQADDPYTIEPDFDQEDDGVYEDVQEIRKNSVEVPQNPNVQNAKVEKSKSEPSSEDTKQNQTEEGQPERRNTASSGDIVNYMLCPNCMQAKSSIFGTTSSSGNDSNPATGANNKSMKYLMSRDPMKEFFVLTAQSVKLNSAYMDTILTLHINEMYEQVVRSNTPFFKWSQWIEDYLHRTILSKIYAEAFETQSKRERKLQQKHRRASIVAHFGEIKPSGRIKCLGYQYFSEIFLCMCGF